MTEFCNTPEEGRLIISNAELYLEQGNVNQALDLLTNIKPNQLYYLQVGVYYSKIFILYSTNFSQFV